MCIFNYFLNKDYLDISRNKRFIIKRRNRFRRVPVVSGGLSLNVGDIVCFIYKHKYFICSFEGILLSIKKNLKNPEVSLIIRNVIFGVGVEYNISYFYYRLYFLRILDYKRKAFFYRRSKLYFVRSKRNRASRI